MFDDWKELIFWTVVVTVFLLCASALLFRAVGCTEKVDIEREKTRQSAIEKGNPYPLLERTRQ